jgi:hypothetical protein
MVEALRRGTTASSVVQLLERHMKRQAELAKRSGANGGSLVPFLAKSLSRRAAHKRPRIRMHGARHLLHARHQPSPVSLRSKP